MEFKLWALAELERLETENAALKEDVVLHEKMRREAFMQSRSAQVIRTTARDLQEFLGRIDGDTTKFQQILDDALEKVEAIVTQEGRPNSIRIEVMV